jgi:pimeloyl-ACP methyl ester carboxylesterase
MSSTPPITHGYAQLEGIRLHYAECGADNSELVLLLHGFPEFWYSWRHQLPVLGQKYHAVAPDLRGYNLSDKPARVEDYAVDLIAKDVIGLIKHFGKEKATIVGHDWGAGVAWAVAQQFPEYITRLAVMQVPPAAAWRANITLRQLLRSWYMLFFQLPRVPEWVISRDDFSGVDRTFTDKVENKNAFNETDIKLYKDALRQPGALSGAVNYYRANVRRLTSRGSREDASSPDARISVPTLFIYGEKDFAIIPETVRGVENYVSGPYREVRIPEGGHWIQNEAPEKVNAALLEFMAAT